MIATAFPSRVLGNGRLSITGSIVRAKSPLRLSLVGGGTDLPHYYEEHGGAVLSTTINRYAYVTVYPRDDRQVRIRSFDLGHMVNYDIDEKPIYNGVMDLVKAAIERIGPKVGMDVDVRTDAPPGSGLGGSSALTSAVIGAMSAMTGTPLTGYEIAELNHTIEREDLKIAGGKQDQYQTTFGGFNFMEFTRDGVIVNTLRVDHDLLNDLEAHLLLCYTGRVRADLGLVDTQIRLYHENRLDILDAMKRIHRMVYEMKDALLTGRLDDVGELLHEAYMNKKRMNPYITDGTPADMLYEAARQHGVIGGKLCGAGGGGYLLLYCRTDRQHEVRQVLEGLGGQTSDVAFDGLGLQLWRSPCR